MDLGAKRAFYLGRYNCIERLGSGPLGETFRAKIYGVAGFEKQFAVKRLHAHLCEDEEFVARFVNAATAYAGLDHARIARVHEVNVQGSQYYVAIDLVRGVDLQRLLEILRQRGEALPTDVALLIALDLADALEHAHARRDLLPSGVLHLGLSAQSVMVTHEGDVRLLDVGLMGALVRLGWADDDALLPVLAYLAPEELRADPLDGRADVFSLAALLYELGSGSPAFPGEFARVVRLRIESAPPAPPACDTRLQALLIQALQVRPESRLASMAALREQLLPILGTRATRARNDLGALVRRLVRPERKTGAFPVVAMPSAGAPPQPRVDSAPHGWAPPVAHKAPAPPPPKGPQLSTLRPRNTFSGLGADDQALVPIELVELPGAVTTPEMAAVLMPDEEATAPIAKLEPEPRNGSTGLYGAGQVPPDTDASIPTLVRDSRLPSLADESSDSSTLPDSARAEAVSELAPFPSQPPPPPHLMQAAPEPALAAMPFPAPAVVRPRAQPSSAYVPPTLELPPLPSSGIWWKVMIFLLVAGGLGGGAFYLFTGMSASQPAIADKPVEPVQPKLVEPRPPKVVAPTPSKIVEPTPPPVVAPPTASTGSIEVATTPTGALLFVDGEPKGAAPQRLSLAPGAHKLVAIAEGHQLRRETVHLPGAPAQLTLALEPAALPTSLNGDAGLKVRCKTLGELRILVDGNDSGRQCPNETRISLQPGAHKIGLYSPRTDQTYEIDKELPAGNNLSTRVYVKY